MGGDIDLSKTVAFSAFVPVALVTLDPTKTCADGLEVDLLHKWSYIESRNGGSHGSLSRLSSYSARSRSLD